MVRVLRGGLSGGVSCVVVVRLAGFRRVINRRSCGRLAGSWGQRRLGCFLGGSCAIFVSGVLIVLRQRTARPHVFVAGLVLNTLPERSQHRGLVLAGVAGRGVVVLRVPMWTS